ncbi:MAG TPA: hypothetical protein DCG22_10515 [Bacteroidetes bacterium]|nr:hypothetical protein [Bacteroidota bacterium]
MSTDPLVEGPVSFRTLQATYDTLYPVADGRFITHNNNYWGVTDSAGLVYLPFQFNGITYVDGKGYLCSTYLESYSLNTGIPRYSYTGLAIQYDENGKKKRQYRFNLTVEFTSDYFWQEQVTLYGPYFFLPEQYRKRIY